MLKDDINRIIEKTAVKLGYSVYESSIYLKGENSHINVKIDSLNGISHNDCQIFSHELSAGLDEENVLPNYFLEISSPGLDRKLKGIDDYIRFKKAPVKVVFDENDARKCIKGIISEVTGSLVEIHEENNKIIKIEYSNIVSANLDY